MCNYESDYYDPESNEIKHFVCSQSPDAELCNFHNPNTLKHPGYEGIIRHNFLKMIEDSNLLFVGYHLPALVLVEKTFNVPVIFQNATIYGPIDFSHSKFKKKSSFLGTKFKEGASFYGSIFSGHIIFQGCIFEKTAYFERAEFNGGVDFSKAQFIGETIFDGSVFRKTSSYSFCKILGEARFIDSDFMHGLDFTNVLIKNPENVIFKPLHGNMTYVRLANTDISRVRFSEDIRFGSREDDKFKIQDDYQLEHEIRLFKKSESSNIPLGAVLGVYRNLRENFEFRMRYDEAGELFIKEMEMKRRYTERWNDGKKKNIIILKNRIVRYLSLTAWYYYLSKYGQSIIRPTLFGMGIVALSTILWFTQPNHSHGFLVNEILFSQNENFTVDHLRDSFQRSLVNFIPLLPSPTSMQLGLIDYIFKIMGGAVTFGLIIIALRRKFERKFRH